MRVRVHWRLAKKRGVRCTEGQIRSLLEGRSDQEVADHLSTSSDVGVEEWAGLKVEPEQGVPGALPRARELVVPSVLGKVRRWIAGTVFGRREASIEVDKR